MAAAVAVVAVAAAEEAEAEEAEAGRRGRRRCAAAAHHGLDQDPSEALEARHGGAGAARRDRGDVVQAAVAVRIARAGDVRPYREGADHGLRVELAGHLRESHRRIARRKAGRGETGRGERVRPLGDDDDHLVGIGAGTGVEAALGRLKGAREARAATQRELVHGLRVVRLAVRVGVRVGGDQQLPAAQLHVHVLIGLGDVDLDESRVLDHRGSGGRSLDDRGLEALQAVAAGARNDAGRAGTGHGEDDRLPAAQGRGLAQRGGRGGEQRQSGDRGDRKSDEHELARLRAGLILSFANPPRPGSRHYLHRRTERPSGFTTLSKKYLPGFGRFASAC